MKFFIKRIVFFSFAFAFFNLIPRARLLFQNQTSAWPDAKQKRMNNRVGQGYYVWPLFYSHTFVKTAGIPWSKTGSVSYSRWFRFDKNTKNQGS